MTMKNRASNMLALPVGFGCFISGGVGNKKHKHIGVPKGLIRLLSGWQKMLAGNRIPYSEA
jgi:hypothetical protein